MNDFIFFYYRSTTGGLFLTFSLKGFKYEINKCKNESWKKKKTTHMMSVVQ